MPSARRFPPPWIIEEHNDACFIVKGDATAGARVFLFHFEEEFGRRSADVRFKATAVIGCVSRETARSLVTLLDRLLRVVGAMQHGQHTAIPARLLRRAAGATLSGLAVSIDTVPGEP